jgi:hypothetical protein
VELVPGPWVCLSLEESGPWGPPEVTLRHRVDNALRFFEEHDELYWNVTGDEWVYPIKTVTAEVRLPAGVQGLRANVFTGRYGEPGRDAETE